MCGIVGLFLKDPALEPELGRMLAGMLVTLSDRGPDSAGIAVYGRPPEGTARLTLRSEDPAHDFGALAADLSAALGAPVEVIRRDTHAVVEFDADLIEAARAEVARLRPGVKVMGAGQAIEIYKEVGLPRTVADRFGLDRMSGTHGIGHTRMATESAVTTLGAHPFSTGPDQCLVHNGSLSNHNAVRRELIRAGMSFETENDTEVAAAFLTHRIAQGDTLKQGMEAMLTGLDGFYTFVVGTRDGFAVLRDPIACKPAVMAETPAYVAFGSEFRALADLPGIEEARIWEPEPATVYSWERAA